MLRMITTLALGMALGYCLFFVRLEGRSLASHATDIWKSPVVQQKVKLVEREIPRALKGSLPAHLPGAIPNAAPSRLEQRQHSRAPTEAHGSAKESWQKDRQELDSLVNRAQQGKQTARSIKR